MSKQLMNIVVGGHLVVDFFCTRAKDLDWRICAFPDLSLIKIDEIVRCTD